LQARHNLTYLYLLFGLFYNCCSSCRQTKTKKATALMRRSQQEMADVFDAEYVSLHVRKSNRAAYHLYSVTLAYEVNDVEKGYYADGEDAYDMRCYFKKKNGATTASSEEKNEKNPAAITSGSNDDKDDDFGDGDDDLPELLEVDEPPTEAMKSLDVTS
jgi:hypothetical protein